MTVFIFSSFDESELNEEKLKQYKVSKDDIILASNSYVGAMDCIIKFMHSSNCSIEIDYIIVKDCEEKEKFELFIPRNMAIFKNTRIVINYDRLLHPKKILTFIIDKIKSIQRQRK